MAAFTDLQFAINDSSKFPEQKLISGPSPYWDKYLEGPSYIKPEDRQKPLVSSGKLDEKYSKYTTELSPLLGTTYSEDVNLADILADDELLRDLAIQVSQRGVVFFKKQEDLTIQQQKDLIQKLGLLSGKPPANGLHKHQTTPGAGIVGESGLVDPEITFITNRRKNLIVDVAGDRTAAEGWHSDITFEPVPADYSSLRIFEQPPSGGDTLWANGYALYEKLSPSLRAYFDTLTGTYSQPLFKRAAVKFQIYSEARGAPENTGDESIAVHPIIRTNPVTGWKAFFGIGSNFTHLNEVTPLEAEALQKLVWDLLVQSHDIHIRHKWDKYDIAIWDNRSTLHAANRDIRLLGDEFRSGVRTVGIAERPYLDVNSLTQTEGLEVLAKQQEEKKFTESLEKTSI